MKSVDTNTIGGRIKLLRSKNKLTQKKMAELLNVTPGTISKWEKNENSPNDHISRIAEIFGVSVDSLLGMQPLSNDTNYRRLSAVEFIESFEVPGSMCVYAEIWKNNIEFGESIYEVWLYDMFYQMKRRVMYDYIKNNTPQLIKERFLANKTQLIKDYRDFFENNGISTVSEEDRFFLESAEEFADSFAEVERELGID